MKIKAFTMIVILVLITFWGCSSDSNEQAEDTGINLKDINAFRDTSGGDIVDAKEDAELSDIIDIIDVSNDVSDIGIDALEDTLIDVPVDVIEDITDEGIDTLGDVLDNDVKEEDVVVEDVSVDVCTPDCTNKECGDDGCGGSCGNCGNNSSCNLGKCECNNGYGDCNNDRNDGCETLLINNNQHCGVCNNSCGNNEFCSGTTCQCNSGFGNCDNDWSNGCEADFSSVNSCGTDCSNIKDCELIVKNITKILCKSNSCDYGSCIYPYEDKDNDRTNGCEYWSSFPKTYGGNGDDYASSIQQTSDGGFVVAGYTKSFGAVYQDFWVIRLNGNGDIIWQRTYGGSSYDYANSIQQTSDGGFVVVGRTQSFGAGNYDFWVIRLDSNGDIIWQKTFGGSNYEEARSIQQTSDGGFVVAGITNSFGAGGDLWVLKLNNDGDIIWQKTYGGSGYDVATSIQQTSDGGFVVAGYTKSFGAGNNDFWVIRLDSNGDIIWQKTFGGSNTDNAYSIQQTSDGGFVMAGYTNSFGVGYDFWVIRLNGNGDIIWKKTFEGSSNDYAYSIQQTSDGGFVVAGYTNSFGAGADDFWVIRLNGNGDIIWQKTYGGSINDWANSIQQTSDGGFVVAGGTNSFGAGNYDMWIIKLDSDGKLMGNCENIEQTSNATVTNISITPANSNATVNNETAITTNTTIKPQDTNCTVQMQCTAP